jgi:hypothetical protein
MMGVVQNHNCMIMGTTTFRSLMNGTKSEMVTPSENANTDCKRNMGMSDKKASVIW